MIAWLRRLHRVTFRPHRAAWIGDIWQWADEGFVEAVWSYRTRNNEKQNIRREREWFTLRHLHAVETVMMFGSVRP